MDGKGHVGKPLRQWPPKDFQPSEGGADDGEAVIGELCSG